MYSGLERKLKDVMLNGNEKEKGYATEELKKLPAYYGAKGSTFIERGGAHAYFQEVLEKLKTLK